MIAVLTLQSADRIETRKELEPPVDAEFYPLVENGI